MSPKAARTPIVAIFQTQWPVQIHTISLAHAISEAGFQVHLYLSEVATMVNRDQFAAVPGMRVYIYSASGARRSWAALTPAGSKVRKVLLQVRNRLRRLCPFPGPSSALPRAGLVESVVRQLGDENVVAYIGIEKRGLVWAHGVFRRRKAALLYYSLELYLNGGPALLNGSISPELKAAEEQAHADCAATIIQDEQRERHLFEDTKAPKQKVIHLPVSLRGGVHGERGAFFDEIRREKGARNLLLYFGMIDEWRLPPEFYKAISILPEELICVLHGYGERRYMTQVRESLSDRLALSLRLVPGDQTTTVVSSADIGLVLYRGRDINDRLTVRSSEKLALYLQCGVPVIAWAHPGYRELFERFGCGIAIQDWSELPDAVRAILADVERYRAGCFECFNAVYSHERVAQGLQQYLAELESR